MSEHERDELGRRIWDVTQRVREGIPTWPGDTAYKEERTWVLEGGCPVNVSKLTLSTHTGTHADAPWHYDGEGERIGEVRLSAYVGIAQLVTVKGDAGGLVGVDAVRDTLDARAKRVLLRTYERFPHEKWDSGFVCPSPELVEYLGSRGVVLLGTDAASMDPESAKELRAHAAIRKYRMAILEGLVFEGVGDGLYELIALPMRLADADAAPVRAVLRELSASE